MNKTNDALGRALWNGASAEINNEEGGPYDPKLVVSLDLERLARAGVDLDAYEPEEINACIWAIPDAYETSDLAHMEFVNTPAARAAVLARGISIEVYDRNGVHYTMRPDQHIVVERDPAVSAMEIGR